MSDRQHTTVEYDRSDDDLACEYCGRPFAEERPLALHRGLAHEGDLSADHEKAFASARESERTELRLFRLKALGVLVLLYFGLLMAFALFA